MNKYFFKPRVGKFRYYKMFDVTWRDKPKMPKPQKSMLVEAFEKYGVIENLKAWNI